MQEPRPRVVRTYFRTRHIRQRVLATAAAAFDGLWLGLMEPEDLGALDEQEYLRMREPHDGQEVTYLDERWTRRGLAGWERDTVERWFPAGGRVLVPGAGGGREVLALRGMGFDAHGFEPNAGLVAAGEPVLAAEGHPGCLHVQPRSRLPRRPGRWDAVLVGWGAYTNIPGRATRVQFLRDLRAHLEPGSPIVVSSWTRGGEPPEQRVTRRVGTAVRALRRRPPVEAGDVLVPHFAHRFTQAELEAEVAGAGFEPAEYEAKPYGRVVARAR